MSGVLFCSAVDGWRNGTCSWWCFGKVPGPEDLLRHWQEPSPDGPLSCRSAYMAAAWQLSIPWNQLQRREDEGRLWFALVSAALRSFPCLLWYTDVRFSSFDDTWFPAECIGLCEAFLYLHCGCGWFSVGSVGFSLVLEHNNDVLSWIQQQEVFWWLLLQPPVQMGVTQVGAEPS